MDELTPVADRARTLENADQLAGALGLYLEAVELDADPVLWNRIGDLQRRIGTAAEAAESYARSVELFVERGLRNNAIAVCRKALRLEPDRTNLLLDVARIAGELGYLSDARGWFQEYAERMEQQGDPGAALAALRSYGEYFPADISIRRALIDRLLAYDRGPEAVAELWSLHRWLAAEGRTEEARAVWEEISALDPTAQEPEPEPAPHAEAPEVEDARHSEADIVAPLPELIPTEAADEQLDPDDLPPQDDDFLPTARPQPPAAAEAEVSPLEGLEQTVHEIGTVEAVPLEALEATEEASAGDLPTLSDDDPVVMRFGDDYDEQDSTSTSATELPQLGGLLGTGDLPDDEEPSAGPSMELEDGDLSDDLADVEPLPLLAPDDLATNADLPRAEPESTGSARPEAERAEAAEVELKPDAAPAPRPTLAALQRRVESAAAEGDRAKLVGAYLELARHFQSSGEAAKAEVVYKSMLEIEPEQEEARAAVGLPEPRPPTTAAADSRSSAVEPEDGQYVNLGELVLSDDDTRELTRFQVAVDEPSGDEDQDFQQILNLFRQQVAIHIDPADAASHYDLGVAFKEMGLLDDAILQFQAALRGGANLLGTLELLGECFAEKGEHSLAARVLVRATQIQSAAEGDLLGVYYLLGRSEESLGRHREAESCFERVIAIDIGFRDAADRLNAIRRFQRP